MIKLFAFLISVNLHILVLVLVWGTSEPKKIANTTPIQIKLKEVPVRKIGRQNIRDNNNLFGQLSYNKNDIKRIDQQVKRQASALSKKEEEKVAQKAKKKLITRNQIIQKQISHESFKSKNWSNELANIQDASVSFIPPRGIDPDRLNEFEKVFYAFYKRVAIQYINSVQISVRNRVNERPYVQNSLQQAPPQQLKAVVRYDDLGNAEIVKIINSSEDDDIHKIFEEALGKMNKIPNIVKDLKDEDGKYYAIFSLSINKRR